MARRFVSQFLLPLVRGGTLFVGRPLSVADVQALIQSTASARSASARAGSRAGEGDPPAARPMDPARAWPELDPVEREAAAALAVARHERLTGLVARPPLPPLDQATWRLGAVIHNLLAMSHPVLATGPGADGRLERIAGVTVALATLGPPTSMRDALARHSLVARLPEVIRRDHTVKHRLGTRTFVGHRPPGHALAMGRLRGIRVESARRTWLRDVGVPGVARATFLALNQSSPLGEALDPLRLDPPPSWARLLSVLRFPGLCRVVAGRLQSQGVEVVGDALATALYRFISLQDGTDATQASADAIAYGLQFLAHLLWLDVMFTRDPAEAASPFPPAPFASGRHPAVASAWASGSAAAPLPTPIVPLPVVPPTGAAGRELAIVLAAAEDVAPGLVWPPDVTPTSELGRQFAARLDRLARAHDVRRQPRWPSARAVAEFAVSAPGPEANAI